MSCDCLSVLHLFAQVPHVAVSAQDRPVIVLMQDSSCECGYKTLFCAGAL